jgi:TetR/AcrR family transcriptional repressor of nem operon
MARPRLFDRDTVLRRAMEVFHDRGFAAASMDDLLAAMKIGRQSLYDSFGDKQRLYHEAVALYQRDSVSAHIERLRAPASPMAGVEAMLLGLIPEDRTARERCCLGISAVAEFGVADAELVRLRAASGATLNKALVERLEAARGCGELPETRDIGTTASFIATTMQGLQVGARAGRTRRDLLGVIRFTLDTLRN